MNQTIDSGMNLYELNKNLVDQLKSLNIFELNNGIDDIVKFCNEKKNSHYMLLNNELHYYTIFEKSKDCEEKLSSSLHEILCDLGEILSIERDADQNSVEIWIKIDNSSYAFYLFPYDLGVVYYE